MKYGLRPKKAKSQLRHFCKNIFAQIHNEHEARATSPMTQLASSL